MNRLILAGLLLLCSFRSNRIREEFIDYPALLRQGIYEYYNEAYTV